MAYDFRDLPLKLDKQVLKCDRNRYLQKLKVHRLKPLVRAIHELPLLNSWRCLTVKTKTNACATE
jgi:hypothetical protein